MHHKGIGLFSINIVINHKGNRLGTFFEKFWMKIYQKMLPVSFRCCCLLHDIYYLNSSFNQEGYKKTNKKLILTVEVTIYM